MSVYSKIPLDEFAATDLPDCDTANHFDADDFRLGMTTEFSRSTEVGETALRCSQE
jgi:hypothetical protein